MEARRHLRTPFNQATGSRGRGSIVASLLPLSKSTPEQLRTKGTAPGGAPQWRYCPHWAPLLCSHWYPQTRGTVPWGFPKTEALCRVSATFKAPWEPSVRNTSQNFREKGTHWTVSKRTSYSENTRHSLKPVSGFTSSFPRMYFISKTWEGVLFLTIARSHLTQERLVGYGKKK